MPHSGRGAASAAGAMVELPRPDKREAVGPPSATDKQVVKANQDQRSDIWSACRPFAAIRQRMVVSHGSERLARIESVSQRPGLIGLYRGIHSRPAAG